MKWVSLFLPIWDTICKLYINISTCAVVSINDWVDWGWDKVLWWSGGAVNTPISSSIRIPWASTNYNRVHRECVLVYIWMSITIHIYIYTYTYTYIYTPYIHIFTHIYTHINTHTNTHTCSKNLFDVRINSQNMFTRRDEVDSESGPVLHSVLGIL